MKRVLLSLAVIFSALACEAQVKVGVKAGLNVHEVSLSDLRRNVETSNRFGFFAGPAISISPGFGFGMDVSLLYENRKLRLREEGQTVEKEYHYVALPINVRYTIGLGDLAGLYIATGPQLTYNVSSRKWSELLHKEVRSDLALRNAEITWNVGAGFALLHHWQVGYNYNIMLASEREHKDGFWIWQNASSIDETWKYNVHQISLTYFF